NRENLPRLQAKLSGASTGLTPWRVTELEGTPSNSFKLHPNPSSYPQNHEFHFSNNPQLTCAECH
ncbi:MAG: hypothetical protein AAFN42_17135, partial [Cyanobacteria bacterium J06554_1]